MNYPAVNISIINKKEEQILQPLTGYVLLSVGRRMSEGNKISVLINNKEHIFFWGGCDRVVIPIMKNSIIQIKDSSLLAEEEITATKDEIKVVRVEYNYSKLSIKEKSKKLVDFNEDMNAVENFEKTCLDEFEKEKENNLLEKIKYAFKTF